ncbi:hypothetical protein TOPH_06977, partial [Tolypocladium ophioglossoides CBS 100239]
GRDERRGHGGAAREALAAAVVDAAVGGDGDVTGLVGLVAGVVVGKVAASAVSTPFRALTNGVGEPTSWNAAVRDAVPALADEPFAERWLLALDYLYHFSPSREPIFQPAAQTLDANVMAFDLILNERASWKDTLLVRIIGPMMSYPLYTFLTEDQYKDELVECGYDRGQIVIHDIADDVFAGVTSYHLVVKAGIVVGLSKSKSE